MWKIVCDYNGLIKTYFLTENNELIIGRSRDAHISIPDPRISRQHLKIFIEDDKPKIRDLQSTNGTLLNSQQISEASITENDIIQIGSTIIKIIPYRNEAIQLEEINFSNKHYNSIINELNEIKKGLEEIKIAPSHEKINNLSNRITFLELLFSNFNRDYNIQLEINKISQSINTIHSPEELVINILDTIIGITKVNRAVFFINNSYNKEKLNLAPFVFINLEEGLILSQKTLQETKTDFPIPYFIELLEQKKTNFFFNNTCKTENSESTPSFLQETCCFGLLLLTIQDKKIGLLYLDSTSPLKKKQWSQFEIEFLKMLASQIAIALDNSLIYTDIKKLYLSTIEVLSSALDAKDTYTEGHSRRVTDYSIALAEELGLEEGEIEKIKIAAILHDIGKIGIRDHILCKPGRLTDEEYEIIKTHPEIGEKIIRPIQFLSDKAIIVKHHHERWDGRGYPSGLKEKEIPLGSRIIALADAFDAMTSKRSYRNNLPLEVALGEIEKCAGSQFDPELAPLFIKVFKKKFLPIWEEYSKQFKAQEKIYEQS